MLGKLSFSYFPVNDPRIVTTTGEKFAGKSGNAVSFSFSFSFSFSNVLRGKPATTYVQSGTIAAPKTGFWRGGMEDEYGGNLKKSEGIYRCSNFASLSGDLMFLKVTSCVP